MDERSGVAPESNQAVAARNGMMEGVGLTTPRLSSGMIHQMDWRTLLVTRHIQSVRIPTFQRA